MNPNTRVVGALELRSAANPVGKPEGLRHRSLPFVGDRQLLASLGATPLENDSAVLGSHPHPEAVRLRAAAGIWLKRAFALLRPGHAVPDVKRAGFREAGGLMGRIVSDTPNCLPPHCAVSGTVNTSRLRRRVSTNAISRVECVRVAGSRRSPEGCGNDHTFGFLPKISTTVEIPVENTNILMS